MLVGESTVQDTHYDILSVKEDATYEEIRTSYRSAILNYHPDKMQKTPNFENESIEKFLKVQKAWEVLSNSTSRAIYDNQLQGSRQDIDIAEDVSLEEMMVEDNGEILELFYQCRCGDYYSVDSMELGELGYVLLKSGNEISVWTPDALPASSVVLPCGSCSLQLRLLINPEMKVPLDDHL